MEIKDMTDAELVEAVAKEALDYATTYPDGSVAIWDRGVKEPFEPITDLNDLFMVLEKVDRWYIEKGEEKYFCQVGDNLDISAENDTLTRAILEARLMAERSEK